MIERVASQTEENSFLTVRQAEARSLSASHDTGGDCRQRRVLGSLLDRH
jgi:hypothetical protein